MVRPGYKQTEVGEIPEDWCLEPLQHFTSFISYGFTNPMPTVSDGIYMITARDINNGRVLFESARCTSFEAFKNLLTSKSRPKKNDVLLTKDGTLGRLALVGDEIICINQSVAILRPNEKAFPLYLKLLLESSTHQAKMLDDAGGSTIKHIYITIVNRMLLGLPKDMAEQKAIAKALSDVDELIVSLEKLIAKKRDIKTATMQQLLTGKKRLPGFGEGKGTKQTELGGIPEDWDVSNLRSVCKFINDGTHHTPNYVPEGIPFYSVENVTANDFENTKFISPHEHETLIRRCKPEKGDILLTRIGTLGTTKLIDWDVNASIYVSLALLKPKDIIDPSYLYSYSKSNQFQRDLEKRSLTNATPQKINMNEIGDIPIAYPSNRDEQEAIAKLTTDMIAELLVLEKRLNKSKSIKQGMMQELLTGRTRLIES